MVSTLKTLWNAFHRYRWHVAALVVFGVLSPLIEGIGINAVVPLMSFFMGGGSGGVASDLITRLIQTLFGFLHIPFNFRYLLGFILGLFILRAISVVMFGYIRGWISADFLSKESEDVMQKTLKSSWAFSLQQKLGSMHNTLVRDVQQTGGLLGSVAQVIQSVSGFLMYLLIAVNISAVMTFYAVAGGATLIFLLRPLVRRAQHIGHESAGVEKQFSQFLNEHIIGMKAIKAAGVERSAIAYGSKHIHLLRNLSIRQSFFNTLGTSFFQPFALVLVSVLFLLTYHSPGFSIISFAASLYLIQKIFTYLESGQNAIQSISGLLPYAKNVAAVKDSLDRNRESAEGTEPFIFTKELSFENVSFSYTDAKPILNSVSFSIRVGETVGLVGPSGAGKTSVADLLLRLFKAQTGNLFLDGIPSEEIMLSTWRTHIGYVSQDVFLLNSTIEDNIRFYNASLTSEAIERAAKQANIYDLIMSLPDGFQTITGDRGVMLSGGQRQRIALARALAASPSLLILDEATSALDHESEKMIHESIKSLHGSMAVFIIAHRPSTVAEADQILVLDKGEIIEKGTPQELLNKPESYFYKMQNA